MARELHYGDIRRKWGVDDPMPNRPDPHADRLALAEVAHASARAAQRSGTNPESVRRPA